MLDKEKIMGKTVNKSAQKVYKCVCVVLCTCEWSTFSKCVKCQLMCPNICSN